LEEIQRPGVSRRSELKRESILEAAIEVFTRGGYESSSMDQVAETAGASKRTVYNYFPSKEAVLRAITERFAEEMREQKAILYDSSESLETQLERFVEAEVGVVRNPRWVGIIRLLVAAFVRSPSLAHETVAKGQSARDSLTEWVRAAAADGRLGAPRPELAASVFRAMLGGAITWPEVYGGGRAPELQDELCRELVAAFLARYPPLLPK